MDFEMPFRRIATNEVLMFAGSIPAVPTLTGGPLEVCEHRWTNRLTTRCSEVGIIPHSGCGGRWFESSHLDNIEKHT